MTLLTSTQAKFLEYLRQQFVGPCDGDDEIVNGNPVYRYLTGMLFPRRQVQSVLELVQDRVDDEGLPDDDDGELEDYVDGTTPADDDLAGLAATTSWEPSSMAMSFVHDGDDLRLMATAARYERRPEEGSGNAERWQRVALEPVAVVVEHDQSGSLELWEGRARLSWRVRPGADGRVVTVAISHAGSVNTPNAKSAVDAVLFQVELRAETTIGHFLPYPASIAAKASKEDRELSLRYRADVGYAVGHGVAVTWDAPPHVRWIATNHVPHEEVHMLRAPEGNYRILEMQRLADATLSPADLALELEQFAAGYEAWISEQDNELSDLTGEDMLLGRDVIERQRTALDRMRAGIQVLQRDPMLLRSFRLANRAMRLQMLGAETAAEHEPRWRPFQLAFILLALPSVNDPTHPDRSVVDLIWFPTGGGKTEAYLGLAAVAMILRRLRGSSRNGGGTAVLTRYTMRLLTTQQFQRTARLICALELLRREGAFGGVAEFSIGLWVGNDTTPSTFVKAAELLKDLKEQASPISPYQIRNCPWCETELLPARRSRDDARYGFRADRHSFTVICTSEECPFNDRIPVQVVDEAIYKDPPTILIATVDKFARLPWLEKGGSLFGLDDSGYDGPELVIQDELHLISGPLGTVVAQYEAGIRALLSWKSGVPPKVIASTATIRAAEQQVRELTASTVAVFPPAGISAKDSYFARLEPEGSGRLYIGLMPQAFPVAWSIGQVSERLLQAPLDLDLAGQERDAYWTLVQYHNSLRELGRAYTILRDDVATSFRARGEGAPEKAVRKVNLDGIVELTSNVSAEQLIEMLERLKTPAGMPAAVDAVAATNLLSVGIDVARLGLMLVNGQPKLTAEYIQATSRVGRGKVPGIVLTLFRSSKPRDRSTFESFRAYHAALYRFVEPTSITPWAPEARRRGLRALLIMLARHALGLTGNSDAQRFDPESAWLKLAVDKVLDHIQIADPDEAKEIRLELQQAIADWGQLIQETPSDLVYSLGQHPKQKRSEDKTPLMTSFDKPGHGWPVMNSMRTVDRMIRLRARGERNE